MKDNLNQNLYEEPEFNIVTFSNVDILKTSGVDEGTPGEDQLPIA